MSLAPALERGLDLLELISKSERGLSYSEILETCGIPTASAARLLKVLVNRGYLAKDGSGLYLLGKGAVYLGAESIRDRLIRAGEPLLESLRSRTGNTALLIYWGGEYLECIGKRLEENAMGMQEVGEVRCNLLGYPWSPFLVRHLHAERISTELAQEEWRYLPAYDPQAKAREAEAAGFALFDQGAFRRYGAPVFRNGHLVGFLGLGGTSLTIPDDQLIEIGTILRRHADLLSEQLSSTQHA